MAGDIKIGSFVGTGAAVTVDLGFVPDYVLVENATDGDANWKWFSGMAAASALQQVAAGTKTLITSNGISADEGTLSSPKGITFGSAISESGKTFRYVAMRNSDY
jgi:hypothetical protein